MDLSQLSVNELLQQGETFRLAGQSIQAIDYFDAVIDKKPDHAWALAHRGAALTQERRYGEAIRSLTDAIKACKEPYIWAYVQRGEAHRLRAIKRLGDERPEPRPENIAQLKLAIEDFNVALSARPMYPYAIAHRAACQRFLGREGLLKAQAGFKQAVELDCGYAWAWAYLSVVNHLLGDEADVFDPLVTAIQLDNTIMDDSSTVMGMYFNGRGKYKEAVQYFEMSLSRNPHKTIARYGLAIAMSHLRKSAGAQPYIESAIAAVSEDLAMAQYELAGLLLLLGREQESLQYLKDAVAHFDSVRQWVHFDSGTWGEKLLRTNLLQKAKQTGSPGTLSGELSDESTPSADPNPAPLTTEEQSFFDLINPTVQID